MIEITFARAVLTEPLVVAVMALLGSCLATSANAAAPGIQGPTFALQAKDASITQPDGQSLYAWGYGCASGFLPTFLPSAISGTCSEMQLPGPTLIVKEGDTVSVSLTNNLPAAAGPTSILFPGFNVITSCAPAADSGLVTAGTKGLLTCEAAPGATVTYTFVAGSPGTRAYYSGTQGDLQIEMGLFGAIIVLPQSPVSDGACKDTLAPMGANATAMKYWGETNFRLSTSAYDHPSTCYDREYLFQFSEMDPSIHAAAYTQVQSASCATIVTSVMGGSGYALGDVLTLSGGGGSGAAALVTGVDATGAITGAAVTGGSEYLSAPVVSGGAGSGAIASVSVSPTCRLNVPTEPYHPAYFLINGRSMPDDMDPNYAPMYPHQPYNGNPHMHPGEVRTTDLLRVKQAL